jgi:hypothetical protein
MSNQPPTKKSMTWLLFAFLTVVSWGVYGVLLHKGTMAMGSPTDPNNRYKAFLFVGFAYFLVAVLAPLVMLRLSGKPGATNFLAYPTQGWVWSLVAGTVGAIGAFGVLLAFGAAPLPKAAYIPVVMSIIFAGAPIVNAFAAMIDHPPTGGLGAIKWQFWLGIILAAGGGFLVARFKPDTSGAGPSHVAAPATAPAQAPKL